MVSDVFLQMGIETRWVGCVKCRSERSQLRVGPNTWAPDCEVCHPIAPPLRIVPSAETSTRYEGNILEHLEEAGVNVRKYREATIAAACDVNDPRSVIRHDPHAVQAAKAWLSAWRAQRGERFAPIDWVFFYGAGSQFNGPGAVRIGELGNGKTFLQIAMARDLIESGDLDPRRYRFTTAEALLMESEATFRGDDMSEKRLLSTYGSLDLLHIDELGARIDPKPHAIRVFDEIAKLREANGTLINSNFSIPVLIRAMPAMIRMFDRITGEVGDGARYLIEFKGKSRRVMRSVQVVE